MEEIDWVDGYANCWRLGRLCPRMGKVYQEMGELIELSF